MRESKAHQLLKLQARDDLLKRGYKLISFDQEIVNGYRPDVILEGEKEVLFVEVVATSDHELKDPLLYHGKPVRFIKYYTLNTWLPKIPQDFAQISITVPFSLLSMFDDEVKRRGYTRSEAIRQAMRRLLETWTGRRL